MARQKTRKRASKQIKNRQKRHIFRYPLFIFLLLCAGAFLIAATFNVTADDILVKAKVSAPLVTSPAQFSPTIIDGMHFNSTPVEISGSCPANAAYVEIFRNNLMDGSGICNNGLFDPLIDLLPGANLLEIHVFNVTDDQGPVSDTRTLYYDVPSSPASGQYITSQAPSTNPLILTTTFVYKGFDVGQEVSWPIEINGGSAPYALDVDWGDGGNDVISRGNSGTFNIKHIYSKPGGYKDSYTIQVKASDSSGRKAYLQFFVIIVSPTSIANNTQSNICDTHAGALYSGALSCSLFSSNRSWLWYAWPAYLLIFLLVLSYWLGEREELIILKKRGVLHR